MGCEDWSWGAGGLLLERGLELGTEEILMLLKNTEVREHVLFE